MTAASTLVSCLMPTANRRAFVPRAIEHFLRQDYPHRELVILDDGADSVADLVPADERIRYERLPARTVLGKKRNLACEHARGEVLVNWDDDDWCAPWRLSYQLDELARASANICGLDRVWFYEPAGGRAWHYVFPPSRRKWVCGGTCCFTREFWLKNRFPEIATGEDTGFIWANRSAKILAHENSDFYVALIHPGNTSRKQTRDARYKLVQADHVRRLMAEDESPSRSACAEPALSAAPAGASPEPPFSERLLPGTAPETKLNLGCCDSILPGYLNVDSVPGPGVEVVDLARPWPWPDSSVAAIRAWDIIEHLPDKLHTMNELWRVLRPNAIVEIAVPTTEGPGAFQDPTHVSFWNRRSFLYYEAGNPYRERFAKQYGISARFRVIRERTDRSEDGPRLSIWLQALKS